MQNLFDQKCSKTENIAEFVYIITPVFSHMTLPKSFWFGAQERFLLPKLKTVFENT